MQRDDQKQVTWQVNYLSTVFVLWVVVGLYLVLPYYENFLGTQTRNTILALAFSYTVVSPIFYLFLRRGSIQPSKSFITLRMLRRVVPQMIHYLNNFPTHYKKTSMPEITETERVALLFLIVKVFFLPIMLNFLFINFHSVRYTLPQVLDISDYSISLFNSLIFSFVLSILLLIDTAYFTFGYLVEAGFLKNQVRSVEPTFLGWASALICYPPFSAFIGSYIIWYANDHVTYWSETWTFVMRIAALVLMGIYVFSSVALGAKCSNLTNRGIVSRGPYAIIRHPAYISKNLAWWITILPVLSLAAVLGMAFWSFVYFLRAITEERHLIRDPDYQAYCKKVRYRFIPRVI